MIKAAIRLMSPVPFDPSGSHVVGNHSDVNVDQDASLKRVREPGSPARGGFSCAGVGRRSAGVAEGPRGSR